MSKEMTPLKALERLTNDVLGISHYYKQFTASEPAILKDKELIENALKDIDYLKILNENQKHNIEMLIEENREMKKSLKALVIIKKKKVNVWCLLRVGLERYNEFVHKKEGQLTQEEFNLLKEVLK